MQTVSTDTLEFLLMILESHARGVKLDGIKRSGDTVFPSSCRDGIGRMWCIAYPTPEEQVVIDIELERMAIVERAYGSQWAINCFKQEIEAELYYRQEFMS